MTDSPTAPTLPIVVHTDDRMTRDAVEAYLRASSRLAVLPPERHAEAAVALVLATEVDDSTMDRLREVSGPVIVLVADRIGERHLLQSFALGLVCYLDRAHSSMPQIRHAVWEAGRGHSMLPGEHIRSLIDRVRNLQRDVLEPHGLALAGFATREIEVLRLLSQGLNTAEVARELNYSERTIKNILAGMMSRLRLRNRSHAVAHALQTGAI
ncbi:LuxR C-terminal-related transcriptional regulator [Streptomyces sp. TLI_171]|uniref:helix-turn-helix transcriptional regulator n=1 Tax=Streptomyces sp. TLI_171 TaxID=1938859 RepID=UPI000C396053|nr:LuxR C-terminal-related transcriptional regulator [Streptomyces sp. TLI_171]RKE22043.1 DNA-binding NarL/FixJ family response regulator [Streptomyces sp. TLI_171]